MERHGIVVSDYTNAFRDWVLNRFRAWRSVMKTLDCPCPRRRRWRLYQPFSREGAKSFLVLEIGDRDLLKSCQPVPFSAIHGERPMNAMPAERPEAGKPDSLWRLPTARPSPRGRGLTRCPSGRPPDGPASPRSVIAREVLCFTSARSGRGARCSRSSERRSTNERPGPNVCSEESTLRGHDVRDLAS
jgi:hypothetical protein